MVLLQALELKPRSQTRHIGRPGACAGVAVSSASSVPAGVEPAASLHLGAAAGLDAVRAGGRLVIGDACALRGMRFAHFVKLYALLCAN